ncbi:hypothetical protein LCGC14_1764070 [marine sediment metagenome]|uniref:Uncharacterized protein n=1 Tax=marine sediment metagenome TaxID=412755 RepID=A0A0F9H051_9ZZZZ
MDVPICDICKEVLKGKSYVYVITERHITDTLKYIENHEDFEEAGMAYKRDVYNQVKKTEQKDMCIICKRIFDYLCRIRRNKLKDLEKAVERIFETNTPTKEKFKLKKGYCKCFVAIDLGDVRNGIHNGICYCCEKKIKKE